MKKTAYLAQGLILAAPLWAGPPRMIFTKSFPASMPAYEFVSIDHDGTLLYKETENDDQPVKAKLSESDTTTLFDFADKLDHFREPLESGLKVANTGKKTFRYESESGAASQTTFNYSTNILAQQLLDRLEQIAESERAYLELDRTAHFDKLGVNDALAEIESLWLRKQLAAPDQFIPLLNRIATHDAYMHLARERAARLKEGFQAGANQADSKTGDRPSSR